jgi:hypothetical protein
MILHSLRAGSSVVTDTGCCPCAARPRLPLDAAEPPVMHASVVRHVQESDLRQADEHWGLGADRAPVYSDATLDRRFALVGERWRESFSVTRRRILPLPGR